MTTVFIAGSLNIKHLAPIVTERLNNIVSSKFKIVVGDADGVDTATQDYLSKVGHPETTVYCSGTSPRNNVGKWPVHVVENHHTPGSRAFFTAKDVAMAEAADYGLMIWDTKSTGTLSNIIELLLRKKKTVVFINKEKTFYTVGSVDQLESLVNLMSEHAKKKAEEKIKLSAKIASLRHEQPGLF